MHPTSKFQNLVRLALSQSVCVTGVLRDGIPTEIQTFVKIGFQNES